MKERLDNISKEAKGYWEKFQETTVGKAFKIATGSTVGRAVTTVTSSLALATAVTALAPVGIAIASAAIVAVGVEALSDTLQVRTIRNLEKENSLLVKNRTAKDVQDYILNLEPKLTKALTSELYLPIRDNKLSTHQRYSQENEKTSLTPASRAILKKGVSIGVGVASAVAKGGILPIVKAVGTNAYGLFAEKNKKNQIEQLKLRFQNQIDLERAKSDSPGYNDYTDLKVETKKQRIQTLAIKALVTQDDYRTLSQDQLKDRFSSLKTEIEAKEKSISSRGFTDGLKSFAKNFGRAHNPFSKYNETKKVVVTDYSPLSKVMDKEKKEAVKVEKVSSPIIKDNSLSPTKNVLKENLASSVKEAKKEANVEKIIKERQMKTTQYRQK